MTLTPLGLKDTQLLDAEGNGALMSGSRLGRVSVRTAARPRSRSQRKPPSKTRDGVTFCSFSRVGALRAGGNGLPRHTATDTVAVNAVFVAQGLLPQPLVPVPFVELRYAPRPRARPSPIARR